MRLNIEKANLTFVLGGVSSENQKRQINNQVLTDLSKNALSMMEGVSKTDTVFTSASHSEHVRPMLMVCNICICIIYV